MFTIFGTDCLYIDIADTFTKKLLALSETDEKGKEFAELFSKSEVTYMLNGATEESCFIVRVPDEYTAEQIQLMADVVIRTITAFNAAPVTVDGVEQKYKINISNIHEPEIIGLRKTPGMSSFEVFKPIINSWAAPGRMNPNFE